MKKAESKVQNEAPAPQAAHAEADIVKAWARELHVSPQYVTDEIVAAIASAAQKHRKAGEIPLVFVERLVEESNAQAIRAPASYDERQPWMTGTWRDLVELVNNPRPGHASDVFHFAFRRTEKLWTAMTLITHSGLNEGDWHGIGDIIELNICIMCQCFEIVSEAWQKADPEHPID